MVGWHPGGDRHGLPGGVPAGAHRGRTPPTGGEHREGAAGARRGPEAVTTAQTPTRAEPLDADASGTDATAPLGAPQARRASAIVRCGRHR